MAVCNLCGGLVSVVDGEYSVAHDPSCPHYKGKKPTPHPSSVSGRAQESSEHLEQVAVIRWCSENKDTYPNVDRIFAIPNGGHRFKSVAGKLKAEGVKAGVPDLFLPVPRGPYHGLFIEMKYGKNKATEKQLGWLSYLGACGYKCAVCTGQDEAIKELKDYYTWSSR